MSLAWTIILSPVELAWSWNEIRNLVLVPGYLGRAGFSKERPQQTTPQTGVCSSEGEPLRGMCKCLNFWEWTAGRAAMGLRASRMWPYFPLNIHVGKTCILLLWYLTVFFHPVCVGLKLSVLCSPPFDFSPITPASSAEWHCFGLISELKLFFTSR